MHFFTSAVDRLHLNTFSDFKYMCNIVLYAVDYIYSLDCGNNVLSDIAIKDINRFVKKTLSCLGKTFMGVQKILSWEFKIDLPSCKSCRNRSCGSSKNNTRSCFTVNSLAKIQT